MIDRARPSFTLHSMRIGRTELGAGTVAIDDDAIVIVLSTSPDDRPVRVPLSTIDAIGIDVGDLDLSIDDGSRLRLTAGGPGEAAELRDEIVRHCRAIPELTRALRAFGSRRGHGSARSSGPAEQQRFFAPLLDARRVAVNASAPLAALEAFDATALARLIAAAVGSFSVDRYGTNGPARRALEAELVDLTEPLRDELGALERVARAAEAQPDDLRLWRVWSAQLQRTFEVADRVWLTVDSALDSEPWRA